jgi:hypothetical protein
MPMFFVAYTVLVVVVMELLLTAVVAARQGNAPLCACLTLDAAFSPTSILT